MWQRINIEEYRDLEIFIYLNISTYKAKAECLSIVDQDWDIKTCIRNVKEKIDQLFSNKTIDDSITKLLSQLEDEVLYNKNEEMVEGFTNGANLLIRKFLNDLKEEQ